MRRFGWGEGVRGENDGTYLKMHRILRTPPDGETFAHKYTAAPVHHGAVAGVDVDADAVAGSGVSGAADGVQTLQPDQTVRFIIRAEGFGGVGGGCEVSSSIRG